MNLNYLKKEISRISGEIQSKKNIKQMTKHKLNNKKKDLKNINNIKELNHNINNNSIIKKYLEQQNNFCNYPDKFYISEFEDLIELKNFSFLSLSYQIYVYKVYDNFISKSIIKTGKYEPKHMLNFLEALQYYGKKKNITDNKDIFMLDIGGNIGAYPSFLGKFGYSILTFEASPRNYYILNKNYCRLIRNSNVIIINKGIGDKEKICNYYSQTDGIGNGILLCDEKRYKIKVSGYNFKKTFDVTLTKLSNFLPYLSNKNLALIKLDIEGGEGKVIEDAIELINKYHVPFIFSEFNPKYLKRQGTSPKYFLQLFINNGYKISNKGFFSKSYISIEQILAHVKRDYNLYFIYNEY